MMNFRMSTALIAIALAGCGSGAGNEADSAGPGGQTSESTASTAQTDPCSLVTAEEVGQVLGEAIVATKPIDGGCTYETQDAQASSVTIELNQTDAAGQMDIAKRTAGFLKGMGPEAAREGGAAGADVNAMLSDSGDSPKLGDDAFFGPNQQLSVIKGRSYIAIQPPIMRSRMSGGSPLLSSDYKKKMAIAIAEKAVGRLP